MIKCSSGLLEILQHGKATALRWLFGICLKLGISDVSSRCLLHEIVAFPFLHLHLSHASVQESSTKCLSSHTTTTTLAPSTYSTAPSYLLRPFRLQEMPGAYAPLPSDVCSSRKHCSPSKIQLSNTSSVKLQNIHVHVHSLTKIRLEHIRKQYQTQLTTRQDRRVCPHELRTKPSNETPLPCARYHPFRAEPNRSPRARRACDNAHGRQQQQSCPHHTVCAKPAVAKPKRTAKVKSTLLTNRFPLLHAHTNCPSHVDSKATPPKPTSSAIAASSLTKFFHLHFSNSGARNHSHHHRSNL